jgi:hypothetical protein
VLAVIGLLATAGLSFVPLLALSIGFAAVAAAFVLLTRRGTIGHWLRTVPRPSDEQLDAAVRALAYSYPGFVPFQPCSEAQPATDEDLCRAWCASYRALQGAASRRTFLRVVGEREGHLDEMERRNPAAFSAWLASGATASDNPLPYLSLAYIEPVVINWDELIDGQGQ